MRFRRFLPASEIGAALLLGTLAAILIRAYSPPAEAAVNRFDLNTKTVAGNEDVISDTTITDLSSATLLTVPANARAVMIQAQVGNVRFRWGTAPTAATGGIIYTGDYLETASSIRTIQLIEESSADAYVAFKY